MGGIKNFIGNLQVSGNPVLTGINTGSFITSSQTGSFITTSQTGAFYPNSNPSGFITGLSFNTGNFITTSQTGLFYAASNPSGFITGYQGVGSQAGWIGINQAPNYFKIDSTNIGNSYDGFGIGAAGNVSIYPNSNLLLNPVGKVGIQNSSPVYDLDVIGSGNFSKGINVSGNPVLTGVQFSDNSFVISSNDYGTGANGTYKKQNNSWVNIKNNGTYYYFSQSNDLGWIFGFYDLTDFNDLLFPDNTTYAGSIGDYPWTTSHWWDGGSYYGFNFSYLPVVPSGIRGNGTTSKQLIFGNPGTSNLPARADHTHAFGDHLPTLKWDGYGGNESARAGIGGGGGNFYFGGNMDGDGNQIHAGSNGCLLYFDQRPGYPDGTFTIYTYQDGQGIINAFSVGADGIAHAPYGLNCGDGSVSASSLILENGFPDTPSQGTISYYNGHFYGYNGSEWLQLDN